MFGIFFKKNSKKSYNTRLKSNRFVSFKKKQRGKTEEKDRSLELLNSALGPEGCKVPIRKLRCCSSSLRWSRKTLNKNQEELTILLECDATLLDAVQKHLKVYKIRRKVGITPCPDLSLWTILPFEQSSKTGSALEVNEKKVVVCTRDPRTDAMGWRLVLSKIDNPLDIVPESHLGEIQDYHRYRYAIGIAEGVKDLPSGEAIPLESNLVYMNGISFTKGCYIGQELTARTHYTGVIRKRLMPVQLGNPLPPNSVPEKAQIVSESGKSAGRLRSYMGDVGLAMIRLAFANEPLQLRTAGDARVQLKASVPDWWPSEENK
ncbi:putative transferase CAF17 homolog, mitochondrial isoform X2 [Scyliorhinus torazame]|uniref:putative transferase CAF17 homolog, mitochondrial isoform X2 n=1 Tax=Scyliorhinus torazame TaxID=75743 RepID=UPI003B5979F8